METLKEKIIKLKIKDTLVKTHVWTVNLGFLSEHDRWKCWIYHWENHGTVGEIKQWKI